MNADTLLHRQVSPAWVQQGRVTSQLFKPTPKDEKKLSLYDGDQISAEGAWEHFTGQLGLKSVGVLSVTKAECETESLRVVPDPTPYPEHIVLDFSELSGGQTEKAAKRLTVTAVERGWQYGPVDAP